MEIKSKSISSSQMRDLDRQATEVHGIPGLQLMENAGKGAADLLLKKYPDAKRILIFCGKGNNGGDGFVMARHLWNGYKEASIVLMADPEELKGDALNNYKALPHRRMKIVSFQEFSSDDRIKTADLIVDAILGIGLKADVEGELRKAIEVINGSGKPVMAIDIPSGLNADEGTIQGVAVKATITAAMGFLKNGMLKNQGPEHCGEICIIDIGLPRLDTPIGF